MNQKIRDYVATRKEPSFFSNPDDEELGFIHTEIQRGIETATDVMTFEIDRDVMLQGQLLYRRGGQNLFAANGFIRLGENTHHLVAQVQNFLQAGYGKVGGTHE